MKKRKYTTPWTFIRSKLVFIIRVIGKFFKGKPGLIHAPGTHLITGQSGAGKTLLMNIIVQDSLRTKGFAWANIDEFFHRHVKVFDLDKIFADGEQKMRLSKKATFYNPLTEKWDDTQFCKMVILDELNARFNRRMNRQTDYNDVFIPLVKFVVTHRHQLCDRVYMIGQSLMLQDGQIQAIIKVRHDVQSSKAWRYWWYREKGIMLYLPRKLIITHFVNKGPDNVGNILWEELHKKTKIKVYPSDIETFDTHAFAKLTDGLPEFKG